MSMAVIRVTMFSTRGQSGVQWRSSRAEDGTAPTPTKLAMRELVDRWSNRTTGLSTVTTETSEQPKSEEDLITDVVVLPFFLND